MSLSGLACGCLHRMSGWLDNALAFGCLHQAFWAGLMQIAGVWLPSSG